MDLQEKIDLLSRRISDLAQQQSTMSRQLVQLIDELEALKKQAVTSDTAQPIIPPVRTAKPATAQPQSIKKSSSSSWEEFIGKNLASKVGILVTIVGIFIGSRYAIEHNLVSPIVRIISGYGSGALLIGLAIYLKKKYEAYSAVLMGGGLAVLYFITYIAYDYYNLLPQTTAFVMMLVFTGASVYVSLVYNRVIIAHLGLVGAYSIPVLLSDNSGRFAILFSYIAIINAGILVISFRKNWKSLFYSAFFLTWIIYASWHLFSYNDQHFALAFIFRGIFFATFYTTFLAYKLVKKEKYGADAIIILLTNAFIFYAFGFDAISQSEPGFDNPGLFTIMNAAIHFGVSQLVRSKLVDRALYYLVFGLTIVFITIAIPVQFDGNWVTLLWTAEAVLMFVIGRTQRVPVYEKISLALLLLGVISLGEDWIRYADEFDQAGNNIRPFGNITFATGLLVAAAAGSMLYIARNKKYEPGPFAENIFRNYFPHIITIIFLLVSYLVFYLEILVYFGHFEAALSREAVDFRNAVLLLYSMIFTIIVVWVNHRFVKSSEMNTASLAAIGLLALVLFMNLPLLNELPKYYYRADAQPYFGAWNITIRYFIIIAMALLLLQGRDAARAYGERSLVARSWQLIIHATALSILSAEYLHWSGISGDGDQYKLGLSILWGVYALYLIVWGIYKKQKHLRLAAILLFIITLVKLFIYDLDESGTVTKTVSFISLGAILLLVSYLYNRYKEVLFGKDE
jgi:uncharacterized membrane protein